MWSATTVVLKLEELDRRVAEQEARLAEAERVLRALPPRASKPAAEAVAFLTEVLASGPRRAVDLLRLAKERGIAERTLRRAKSALGVVSVRVRRAPGRRHENWWRLPKAA